MMKILIITFALIQAQVATADLRCGMANRGASPYQRYKLTDLGDSRIKLEVAETVNSRVMVRPKYKSKACLVGKISNAGFSYVELGADGDCGYIELKRVGTTQYRGVIYLDGNVNDGTTKITSYPDQEIPVICAFPMH